MNEENVFGVLSLIQRLAGHQHISTTMKYMHLSPTPRRGDRLARRRVDPSGAGRWRTWRNRGEGAGLLAKSPALPGFRRAGEGIRTLDVHLGKATRSDGEHGTLTRGTVSSWAS